METKKKQIIAIGGGGFGKKDSKLISLEEYFLQQTGKSKPSICFIPTASGESQSYIVDFYREFSKLNCIPSHLSLFKPPTADLESFILEHDAIFVGGGNTKSMIALWKEWHLDKILKKAWEAGIVLGGTSAGSICWFEEGMTDSIPGPLTVIKGLGFLKGSNCPHYDDETERKPMYEQRMLKGEIGSGIAIEANVAVHFIDDAIFKVVKAKPQSNAFQVSVDDKKIVYKSL